MEKIRNTFKNNISKETITELTTQRNKFSKIPKKSEKQSYPSSIYDLFSRTSSSGSTVVYTSSNNKKSSFVVGLIVVGGGVVVTGILGGGGSNARLGFLKHRLQLSELSTGSSLS